MRHTLMDMSRWAVAREAMASNWLLTILAVAAASAGPLYDLAVVQPAVAEATLRVLETQDFSGFEVVNQLLWTPIWIAVLASPIQFWFAATIMNHALFATPEARPTAPPSARALRFTIIGLVLTGIILAPFLVAMSQLESFFDPSTFGSTEETDAAAIAFLEAAGPYILVGLGLFVIYFFGFLKFGTVFPAIMDGGDDSLAAAGRRGHGFTLFARFLTVILAMVGMTLTLGLIGLSYAVAQLDTEILSDPTFELRLPIAIGSDPVMWFITVLQGVVSAYSMAVVWTTLSKHYVIREVALQTEEAA